MTSTISTLQSEARTYDPPAGARDANVGPEAFDRAEADPIAFWEDAARRLDWADAVAHGATRGLPRSTTADGDAHRAAGAVVRRRAAQRRRELRRPARRRRPRRQGRAALRGRARRPPDAHVRRPAARGLAGGARADRPRHRPGRPRRRLPAGARRDRDRDARHRPDRRRALAGVRRASPPRRCGSGCRTPGAKLLVTSDGQFRRGQAVEVKSTADEAVAGLDHVEHVLVVRRTGAGRAVDRRARRLVARRRRHAPRTCTRRRRSTPSTRCSSSTPRAPPGSPKGLVHTSGGYLTHAALGALGALRRQARRRALVHRRPGVGHRAHLRDLRPAGQRAHAGHLRGHARHARTASATSRSSSATA